MRPVATEHLLWFCIVPYSTVCVLLSSNISSNEIWWWWWWWWCSQYHVTSSTHKPGWTCGRRWLRVSSQCNWQYARTTEPQGYAHCTGYSSYLLTECFFHRFVRFLMYFIITTCSVECYWHCSDDAVH